MPENQNAPEINNIKINTGIATLEIRDLAGSIAHVHCTNGNCSFDKIEVPINEGSVTVGAPDSTPVNAPPIHHIGLSRDRNGKLSLHLHLNKP